MPLNPGAGPPNVPGMGGQTDQQRVQDHGTTQGGSNGYRGGPGKYSTWNTPQAPPALSGQPDGPPKADPLPTNPAPAGSQTSPSGPGTGTPQNGGNPGSGSQGPVNSGPAQAQKPPSVDAWEQAAGPNAIGDFEAPGSFWSDVGASFTAIFWTSPKKFVTKTAGAAKNAVLNPIATAQSAWDGIKGAGNAIAHPIATAQALGDSLAKSGSDLLNAPVAKQAEAIGDLLVEAATTKGLGAAAKGAKALNIASALVSTGGSPWNLGNFRRGWAIERMLGQNLPGAFRTIDRFADGIATSIKSMDLSAKKFLDPDAITNVGQAYIDKVASFDGGAWGPAQVLRGDITGRALDLAIPLGADSPEQMKALAGLVEYGKSAGVNVRIVGIP